MQLKHTLTATSLACLLPLTALAEGLTLPEDISFYGKAEIQLNFTDKGKTSAQDGLRYVSEGTQIDSPFSRIGFKGSHKLSESLSGVFKFEYQVKGFDSSTDTLTARNTYIGLKGNFGEVVFGRNDTRFKASEGKFDLFNETVADIGQVLAGQDRLGDTLTYTSPRFSTVQVAFTAAPKDDSGASDNGYAWSVTAGDKTMKKSPYYAAYAGTQDLGGLTMQRILLNYRIEALTLGALLQQSETSDGSKDGNGYMLNAAYSTGNIVTKIQYASDDSKIRHSEESEQLTIGADYLFDKQTKIYVLYTHIDLETSNDNNLGFGLKYNF
ncbi:MAG: putative porin [Paraglaciecola sp.]|jgi:predicted porin